MPEESVLEEVNREKETGAIEPAPVDRNAQLERGYPRTARKQRKKRSETPSTFMFTAYSAQKEGTMTKKLAGKVAFVTGASSGIGEATALALAEEGARVAVLARRSDRLEQIVKRIKDAGGEAVPLVADVTNEAQLRAAIRQAKEALGCIDIM